MSAIVTIYDHSRRDAVVIYMPLNPFIEHFKKLRGAEVVIERTHYGLLIREAMIDDNYRLKVITHTGCYLTYSGADVKNYIGKWDYEIEEDTIHLTKNEE